MVTKMNKICYVEMNNTRDCSIKDYTNAIMNGNGYSLIKYYSKRFKQCERKIEKYNLIFDRTPWHITALKSYNTTVFIILETTDKKFIMCSGSYSKTTLQHIHKFIKQYNVPIKSLLDIDYCTLYEI